MSKKIIVPQKGETLKDLRDRRNLSQLRMAEQLEKVLYDATQVRYSIQQSDVSRLETEKATIDLPKLLAYVLLCKVSASELITAPFNVLLNHPGAMRLHTFTRDQDAERKLLELEQGGRVLISPEFPSSFFRLSPDSSRFKQLDSPDYLSREIYTASLSEFPVFPGESLQPGRQNPYSENLYPVFSAKHQSQPVFLFRVTVADLQPAAHAATATGTPDPADLGPCITFTAVMPSSRSAIRAFILMQPRFTANCRPLKTAPFICASGLETLEKMRAGGLAREAIQFWPGSDAHQQCPDRD
ncbi:MAG: helix-turn-helix transcriptional regulator [Thiolinea sp.]